MHLCWTGLQPNLLKHKHSWKLSEDTNQWMNIALEEYQLIWQSLSMEWNYLQDNTSSGGPEKSLFCLVIAGYPGLGRPLFRNLIKHMQEHCQKLHPRSKDVMEKHQEILKVSWQQLTHQKRAKMSWKRFLVSWKQLTHQKERRPLSLGKILLSTTQMLPKDINSVPSTRHCWLDAEHHTPFLTCWWDEVHTTVSTNPCWAQYHISLLQRVCHTIPCYTSGSCLMFIICRTDKWSRSYWTCPQSHHTHYTITST